MKPAGLRHRFDFSSGVGPLLLPDIVSADRRVIDMETGAERPAPSSHAQAAAAFLENVQISAVLTSPAGKVVGRTFGFVQETIAQASGYTSSERHRIVDQLIVALNLFYVHLERKKSLYGFDPVRALHLLALRLEQLSDGEFHESVIEVIARTRDRHLSFAGRTPYGVSAVLPLAIEQCWEGSRPVYLATKLDPSVAFTSLRAGARITHWNGIPIERFIHLNANLFDGGNEAASMARSLAFLTHRPLNRFGPPMEEWVDLTFALGEVTGAERLYWQGLDNTQMPALPALGRGVTGFGGDLDLFYMQRARQIRFAPQTLDGETDSVGPPPSGVPFIEGRDPKGVFEYGTLSTASGTFGYIRLWSFRAEAVDDLVTALATIVSTLPATGLVLDIRGNSGGYIAAGERILQLLSAHSITPTRFEFRVTEATAAVARSSSDFSAWVPYFSESFRTGETYTRGFPIEGTDSDANKIGRRYFGPVVLVTDALAFSTADVFAAGFIDNDVGRVICVDDNMAAAGGNNWVPWDVVRLYNPDFYLDPTLKSGLDGGTLGPAVFDAFNREGVSLSRLAALSPVRSEYDGSAWTIHDGAINHVIRHLPSEDAPLRVYLQVSRLGLADMPEGVVVSVTMRRCVRVKKNEGRILEDVGIVPDVRYRMTVKDVMDQNRDLFARVGLELSQMASPTA